MNDRELNLTTHRKASSVWQRPSLKRRRLRRALVRAVVGVGGGLIAVQALRANRPALAGVGGSLVCWALIARGDPALARRFVGVVLERAPWRRNADPVQLASDDSFPASDPPAWTPTVGTGLGRPVPVH